MGLTKTATIDPKILRLAAIAKALGHPARMAIVDYLMKQKSCICKDIVDELPIAQPTVSRHLKELKEVGIIQGNIEGTSVCYCLHPDALTELFSYCNQIMNSQSNLGGACC